jgi:hypothetical protein
MSFEKANDTKFFVSFTVQMTLNLSLASFEKANDTKILCKTEHTQNPLFSQPCLTSHAQRLQYLLL